MYEAEERQWWYAGMRAISLGLLDGPAPARSGGRRASSTRAAAPATTSAPGPPRPRGGRGPLGGGAALLPRARRGRRARRACSSPALRRRALRLRDLVRRALPPLGDGRPRRRCASWRACCGRGACCSCACPPSRLLWGAHDEAVHSRHRYTRGGGAGPAGGGGPRRWCALSYRNTFLFPLLALRRALDRLTGRHGSDVGFLPAPAGVGLPRASSASRRAWCAACSPARGGQRVGPGAQAERPVTIPRLQSVVRRGRERAQRRGARRRRAARMRERARARAARRPRGRTSCRRPRVARARAGAHAEPRPRGARRAAPAPRQPGPQRALAAAPRPLRGRPAAAAWPAACGRPAGPATWRPRRPSTPGRCSSTTRSSPTSTPAWTPPTATTTTCWAIHGRHMGEIDERHLILQEELVAHVHDLVKRIDLVLAEAERGRSAWSRPAGPADAPGRLEERLRRGSRSRTARG